MRTFQPKNRSLSFIARCAALLLFSVLALLVSACASAQAADGVAVHTPQATPPPTQTTLAAVLPLLQQSAQATLKITSFHFDLQGRGSVQTGGGLLPGLANKTPYSLHAQGDVSLTNHEGRVQGQLTLRPPKSTPLTFKGKALLSWPKLYLKAPTTGQWFVLDLTSLPQLFMGGAGLQPQPPALLALAQQVTVVDHGVTTLDGLRIRHLTLSIGKGVLGQIAAMVSQPMVKQALQSIQLLTGISVDVFIDTATSLPHRLEIKGSILLKVDALLAATGTAITPPAAGAAPRTISVSFDLSLTLSKYNQPVKKVTPPTKAVPIQLGATATS